MNLRDDLNEEDRQRAHSYAHRLMDAINELHEEFGRVPTGHEVEAKIERRKTPRPAELTYELDEDIT